VRIRLGLVDVEVRGEVGIGGGGISVRDKGLDWRQGLQTTGSS